MKIKEEMMEEIKEAQVRLSSIQNELGSLPLRKEALIRAYADQEAKAQAITDTIREEYGDGVINLETGEFTASEEE